MKVRASGKTVKTVLKMMKMHGKTGAKERHRIQGKRAKGKAVFQILKLL